MLFASAARGFILKKVFLIQNERIENEIFNLSDFNITCLLTLPANLQKDA